MTIQPDRLFPHPVPPREFSEPPVPQAGNLSASAFDIAEVVAAIWRRKLALTLWLSVCLALAVWYLAVTPITFTAAATVILEPRQSVGPPTTASANAATLALDVAQAESQIQVIRSERILSSVFDILSLQDAPEFVPQGPGLKDQLLMALGLADTETASEAERRARTFQAFSDRVGVRRLGQSYVVEVSYQAGSPEQAARVANAIAIQYIKSQIDVKAAAATQGTEYLRGRIANLQAEQQAASEGVRNGRIPDMLFSDADARIIGAALPPLNKSYPKVGLILAFAVTFGAMTGLLTIAVRQALDRTLDTRRRVRDALGVECLGILPRTTRMRGRDQRRFSRLPLAHLALDHPVSAFVAALRGIRTAILVALPAKRGWAIGIASFGPREGRSTVAVNLAFLLSGANEAVELIDADFRNPTLTNMLAPEAPEGLAGILLSGEGTKQDRGVALSPSLGLIPAVAEGESAGPNLYLGSEQMQALLVRLRATRNVVVDLPPIAASSDVQALGQHLDGIVLVVEAGRTKIEEAAEAIRIIQAGRGRLIGVVLNKAGPGPTQRWTV